MPSSLRRLLRAPLRAVAVGALAVLLLGSALLQDAASAALAGGVDPASRGIYDILVTADDGAAAPTLLAPNSLNTGAELLGLDDVRAIRELGGVEVAAPIAQFVLPDQRYMPSQLVIPVDPEQGTPLPYSYKATVRLIGDDGLGERLISESTFGLTIDRSSAPLELPPLPDDERQNQICSLGDVSISCELFPWGEQLRIRSVAWGQALDGSQTFNGGSDGSVIRIGLPSGVHADMRMTLIDPVAERELLGASGGFLDPLIALGGSAPVGSDEIALWARGQDTRQATAITEMERARQEAQEAFLDSPAYAEYARVMTERGEQPDPSVYGGGSYTVVPILVAEDRSTRPLRAELSVESFGPTPEFPVSSMSDPFSVGPTLPEGLRNGEQGVALPPVDADASAMLDPISGAAVEIPWPGGSPVSPQQYPADLTYIELSQAIGVADVAPSAVGLSSLGTPVVRLHGSGFRELSTSADLYNGGNGAVGVLDEAGSAGSESAFSVVRRPKLGGFLQAEYQSAFSVGGFSEVELRAVTELAAGIPLGAYERSDATLLEDGEGNAVPPGTSVGGLGALGLAGSRTDSIADISSSAFKNDQRVDAVRVRVAGVGSYDAAGIAAVTQAARDIEQLGYRAIIVAGSHGENVGVSVGGYAFGSVDAATPQRVGELGVIEQRWSVLGPAAGAGTSLGAGAQLLLGTALLSVLGAFALIELGAVPARRREAAVLRGIGWRHRRIVAWFAAEYVAALPIVAAAGVAAVVFAADPALTATVVAAALLAGTAIALTALARSTRAPRSWTASEAEVQDALDYARAQELERRPEARVLGAEQSAAESVPAARAVRMPRSPVLWGVQRAWRSPAVSLPRAAAVGAVMGPIAALTATAAEPGGGGLAQLLFAAAGVAAGLALLAVLRQRERTAAAGEPGGAAAPHLVASGWSQREARLAGRAETLAAPLAAALLGSYALWFVLSSVGIDSVNTPVSAALVAGLAAAALFLLPHRRPAHTAHSPHAPTRKAALFRGIAS